MSLHDNLKKMSRDELVKFADTQGVQVHWKSKPETIIKQIIDKVTAPVQTIHKELPTVINGVEVEKPKMTALTAKRFADAEEAKNNTPESIEAAIAGIKARAPEFTSVYDRGENTWQFSCKGALESGNIEIPMRKIIRIAENVSRGRLLLMGVNDHFDKTTARGHNAYTNTVLAG